MAKRIGVCREIYACVAHMSPYKSVETVKSREHGASSALRGEAGRTTTYVVIAK